VRNTIRVAIAGLVLAFVASSALPDAASDQAKKQQKLLKQLAKDKDADARRSAAEDLGDIGGPEVLAALTAALKDPSPEVRGAVVNVLGKMMGASAATGGPNTMAALTGALNDTSPEVRRSVVNVLRAVDSAEASTALAGALKDPSPEVRSDAAGAFVNRKNVPKDVLPLLKARLGDSEALVRYNILAALSNLGETSPDMAPVLGPFLRSSEPDERRQCFKILLALGLDHPEVQTVVRGAVTQPDASLRREAVDTLKGDAIAGGEIWVKELLTGVAKTDTDPTVRSAAEGALAAISETMASPGYVACRLVTLEESAVLLGPQPHLSRSGDGCYFIASDNTLQLIVAIFRNTSAEHLRLITRPAMTKDGLAVQEEPSLPRGSFSGRKATHFDFHILGPKGVLQLALISNPEMRNEIPAALFDKLRDLARKVAARPY
jgi:HEAT repeat protein